MNRSYILDDIDLEVLNVTTIFEVVEYTPNEDLSKAVLNRTTRVIGVASAIDAAKHSKGFVPTVPSLN